MMEWVRRRQTTGFAGIFGSVSRLMLHCACKTGYVGRPCTSQGGASMQDTILARATDIGSGLRVSRNQQPKTG